MAVNAAVMSGSKLFGDLATFALFVAISRIYGQEGSGQYSFAMGLTGIFLVLSSFGLYNVIVVRLSRADKVPRPFLGSVLVLYVVLAAISLLLLTAAALWLPLSADARVVVLLLGAYQILSAFLGGAMAVFMGRERVGTAAAFEFSLRATIAVAGLLAIAYDMPLSRVVAVFPVATALHVLAALALLARQLDPPSLPVKFGCYRRTLADGWSYAKTTIAQQVFSRVDVIVLGLIVSEAAAGLYNTAYRLAFLLVLLSSFASTAILPVAARLHKDAGTGLNYLFVRTMRGVALLALPLSVGTWFTAPQIIELFYGQEFESSVLVLRMLSLFVAIGICNAVLGMFMFATDSQDARARASWFTGLCNLGLNVLLIPLLGLAGAAGATIVAEAILAILLFRHLRRFFGWPRIGSTVALAVLGSLAFCAIFSIAAPWPLWVTVPGSGIVYLGVIALSRDFRACEGAELLAILKSIESSLRTKA